MCTILFTTEDHQSHFMDYSFSFQTFCEQRVIYFIVLIKHYMQTIKLNACKHTHTHRYAHAHTGMHAHTAHPPTPN